MSGEETFDLGFKGLGVGQVYLSQEKMFGKRGSMQSCHMHIGLELGEETRHIQRLGL